MLTKLEVNNKRWLFDPDLEDKYTGNEIQLKNYGIHNYKFNDDGTIDINGDVVFPSKHLSKIPLKFNKVKGSFGCSNNKITSLEGAPKSVGGSFGCSHNKLTSLEGAPEYVEGDFNCDSNNLTSLEFAPKSVSGNFNCNNNSTKFTPEDVRAVCEVKGKILC